MRVVFRHILITVSRFDYSREERGGGEQGEGGGGEGGDREGVSEKVKSG